MLGLGRGRGLPVLPVLLVLVLASRAENTGRGSATEEEAWGAGC